MKIHPAAEIFPMLTDAELTALADDIKTNGLHVKIGVYEAQIIDGRNRFAACKKAGVEPAFTTVMLSDGVSPWAYVWSLNATRRHLEPGQKVAIRIDAMAADEAWLSERAIAREKANKARSETQKGIPKTVERAPSAEGRRSESATAKLLAKDSDASRATVERVQRIKREAPELFEQVKAGTLAVNEATREVIRRKVQARVIEQPSGRFRVLYADPPWSYGNNMPEGTTTPRDHYPTMTLSEICAMPVKQMAEDDAVLFLWVTSPLLQESFDVIQAWGFRYKTSFIWDKVKHNMGHYNSVRHELLLVCTRGACTPDVRKLFDSVVTEERTEHSKKPTIFYEMIETIYTRGRRLELFARNARDGWTAYGLEAPHVAA